MTGHWVAGATFNHTWSYKTDDLNSFFAQYFITYNIKKGWYVNTNPMITSNWNAPEGEQWTVPFGAGGGKVFVAGKQPMKLQAQAYVNAVAPPGAPDWTLQIQYVLLSTSVQLSVAIILLSEPEAFESRTSTLLTVWLEPVYLKYHSVPLDVEHRYISSKSIIPVT